MADGTKGNAPPCIAALPPTTVRQIGSHQLLTDPSSVVKELIDNALDARAKSIFVDIAANSIDSVQVKDDGHGIPSEDRTLACRRYCTSKIRDFRDLKEVGGKWLGFRGEALASLADMSGTVSITTRVEGEPVAVTLTYQRNGELLSTERDSHPVGTTIKATKLFESTKVRKQLAIKDSMKCLAKIRRLMQAYALARPAIRFRLHVLKAKNGKGDFVYAPKTNANVEDAALKVIGKECALQCQWTALEMGGFDVHAFLPSSTAIGTKIANQCAFISVDSRPVSSARGTLKKIANAVRDKIRKANPTLTAVKDPFFCLNLICPPDSYDPNVEPAKDNVMFGDEHIIMNLVSRLLVSYYPESSSSPGVVEETEDAMITQPSHASCIEDVLPRPLTPFSIRQKDPVEEIKGFSSPKHDQQPHWRSSMYGIDEDDLAYLQENVPPVVEEEEEGRRDAAVSNPWTIARMNAPVKPKKPTSFGQLPSPAKSQSDMSTAPQSPMPAVTPHQARRFEPLTPQTSSRTNAHGDRIGDELPRSFQFPKEPVYQIESNASGAQTHHHFELSLSKETSSHPEIPRLALQARVPNTSTVGSAVPRHNPKPRPPRSKPYVLPTLQSDETWFGQPMRSASRASRSQKQSQQRKLLFFTNEDTLNSQGSLALPEREDLATARQDNTDIRDFFGHPRCAPSDGGYPALSGGSQQPSITEQLRAYAEQQSPSRISTCRPRSVDSQQRSMDTTKEMEELFKFHQTVSPGPSSDPIRTTRPSDMASAPRSASQPRRRRTTDGGLHRNRSSTLPLNFVPHGYEIHSLCLAVSTSVATIVHQARKLDMSANSLEWGYDSTDGFDMFGTSITEGKITEWTTKVDDMLHAVFERIDSVEILGALHEDIQRFLDTRKAEERMDVGRAIAAVDRNTPTSSIEDEDEDEDASSKHVNGACGFPTPSLPDRGLGVIAQVENGSGDDSATPSRKQETAAAMVKLDEYENDDNVNVDFDFSQFVDLNGDAGRQGSPVPISKVGEDFGDGVDDEMLMDL
ncbi:hypothetical protein EKO04_002446 [Ascochyta lentis]|uniref:DNA mismatch repair protein S5 domain-containing protein n=1 Tax=Ascochyta lentis TaxID=205686 RepID=A0A8H7MG80_9PLEO|nr:hypothetical protein EKO04_002446 [Ascochyta lentis]